MLDVPLPRVVAVAALSACSIASRWSNLPGGEGTGSLWKARCLAGSHFPVFVHEGPFFFFYSCRTWLNVHCVPEPVLGAILSDQFEKWHQNLQRCVRVRGCESREAGGQVTMVDAAGSPHRSLLTSRAAKTQWGECWLLLAHSYPLPGSCLLYRHKTD